MSVSHNDYAMEREPWGLLTDCEQLQKMVFAGELKTVLKERLLHITGVVKDDTGKPLSGAEVYFLCRSPKVRYEGIPSKTDAAGRFDYSAAPNALSEFTVIAEGFALETRKVPVGTAPMELEFVLKPTPAIEGIVVDVEGKPIEEGQLFIKEWANSPNESKRRGTRWGGSGHTAVAGEKQAGRFLVKDVTEESVTGRFFSGGEQMKNRYMWEEVLLKPGVENKVVIRPATQVSIKVVDAASGASIMSYAVECRDFHSPNGKKRVHWTSPAFTRTKDKGMFYHTFPDPKQDIIFEVSAKHYLPATTERVKPDGTDRDFVIKLVREDS
jgi:hypothetical protein